jgi:hypothetical protein
VEGHTGALEYPGHHRLGVPQHRFLGKEISDLSHRVKALLRSPHAGISAPRKQKSVSAGKKNAAQRTDWGGNQAHLHKLGPPTLPRLPDERIGAKQPPNLFLPDAGDRPYDVFSNLHGLSDAVGPLPKHKNIKIREPETSSNPKTAKNKDIIRSFGSKSTVLLAVAMEENNTISSDYPFGDVYPKLVAPGFDPRQAVHEQFSGKLGLIEAKPETYTYQPDELPGGQKHGDAANFGLYKMNWLMISQTETGKKLIKQERARQAREIHKAKQDFAPTDWNVEAAVGGKINADTALATRIMLEAMDKWHAEIPPDPTRPKPGNFWAGHRAGWTGLNSPASADWDDILFYYDAVMAIKGQLDSDKEGKLTGGRSRIGVDVINR